MPVDDDGFTPMNWVWVPDLEECFVKGYITDYLNNGKCKVTVTKDNKEEHRIVENGKIESCNPSKFNKCDDMAALTHLNEPSVVNNLYLRYFDDLIYTYSGLFLVAINPYRPLQIYNQDVLDKYHLLETGNLPPHIFATAEGTYRNLLQNKKNQSILVTGESGAGKTENTKKIIQYLSSVTTSELPVNDDIDEKILQANPILESFGNAKTIKNNNSSRFGKFIKLYFDDSGTIKGANISYYLLEKSRVVSQAKDERNYHVFYLFLKGLDEEKLKSFSLLNKVEEYGYLRNTYVQIPHLDDTKEFKNLMEAFHTLGLAEEEIGNILSILAVILQLGNIEFVSWKAEQARFKSDKQIRVVSDLLGLDELLLSQSFLKPKVKAGREMIIKSKKALEVKYAIDAFARHTFERLFQYVIRKINRSLDSTNGSSGQSFIGVLDIAGFEIFQQNSFEQLCINYTNEKLQQFFNHHSFILEQSEYLREEIQWEYIDFGLDLQPTIDLIELKKPLGIFKILDEECVVPKATDSSFMENLAKSWGNGKSKKFSQNKIKSGFIVRHYAGDVEYNVQDWLKKNTDPVSENVLTLFSGTKNSFARELFAEDIELIEQGSSNRKIKLKTASQKYKEQLSSLMEQLNQTEPQFVRCILPNLQKLPKKFDKKLVLNQLTCNGVLEGIRITRAGYPNRMTFEDFISRYSIINLKEVFTKSEKTNSELLIRYLNLDPDSYKVGRTKIFFKNGVLGKLEELRDLSLKRIFTSFQSIVRGKSIRHTMESKIKGIQSSQVIAKNMMTLDESLKANLWFRLFIQMKPLLKDSIKIHDSKQLNNSLKRANEDLEAIKQSKQELDKQNVSLWDKIEKLETELISTTQLLQEKDKQLSATKQSETSSTKRGHTLLMELDRLKASYDLIVEKQSQVNLKLQSKTIELDEKREEYSILKSDHNNNLKLLEKMKSKLLEIETDSDVNNRMLRDENEVIQAKFQQKLNEVEEMKSKGISYQQTLDKHNASLAEKEIMISALESKISKTEANSEKNKSKEISFNQRINELQSQLANQVAEAKAFRSSYDELLRDRNHLEQERDSLKSKLDTLQTELNKVQQETKNGLEWKEKYSTILSEKNKIATSAEELKFQYGLAIKSRDQYSQENITMRESLRKFEEKENETARSQIKENIPPNSQYMEEATNAKLRLNEQSALLRKERFENKQLKEEISLLKSREHDKQIKREPSKRSQSEKESRLELDKIDLQEEIQRLNAKVQQEEANSQRAENYAIELQRKMNKLQSQVDNGEGITKNDFESSRAPKPGDAFSPSSSISKSLSRSSHSQDFQNIYQDLNKILKSTREELYASKSEILRLKSLLRESEDQLYDVKRESLRNSFSEYQNELTQLRNSGATLKLKNQELTQSVGLFKRRSEEYFEKLELAESAVNLSKKKEQVATKDLLDTKNQLTLAREELRTTQIVIKDMRRQSSKLEESLTDKRFETNSMRNEISKLEEKIGYFTKNYGKVEVTNKYKDEIFNLHKELDFKMKTETNLVKENKAFQLDLEDSKKIKSSLETELNLMQQEINQMEDQITELVKNKRTLEESNQKFERKLNALNKQVTSFKELIEELSTERDQLRQLKFSLTSQVNELNSSLQEKDQELEHTKSNLSFIREHMENQRKESEEMRSELNNSRSSKSNEIQEYQKLRNEALVTGEENDSLKRSNKELIARVNDLDDKLYNNGQLKYWEEKIDSLTNELDRSNHQNHYTEKMMSNMKRSLNELELRLENESVLTKKYSDENFDFQNRIIKLKSNIDILHNENHEKDIQLKMKERELSELKESKMELERELLESRDLTH